MVQERACKKTNPDCVFPDYPGSVGWKSGLLAICNAPVDDSGGELNNDIPDLTNWLNGSQHRLRFDRERRPYLHYGLGAHTRGTGILPCLTNPGGNPTGYFEFGICGDPAHLTPINLTLRSPPTRFLRLPGGLPTCLAATSWRHTGFGTSRWEGHTLVP